MILLELAHEAGLDPKWAASTEGGEYKSACPNCGGRDRFSVQPNKQMQKCLGRYYCRQCGIHGDAIEFAREFCGLTFQEACEPVIAEPTAIKEPPSLWIQNATQLTQRAHQNILDNKDALRWLASRGLPKEAVIKYQIGYWAHDQWINKKDWRLADADKAKLWIPEGIVIPTLNKSGNVMRLKIRRTNCQPNDKQKYIALSGSMGGYNLLGSPSHKTILVVESELDGYAAHWAAEDLLLVIAVGNNIKNPDSASDYYLKNCDQLLICHDNDAGGKTMLDRFQTRYKHAQALPTPYSKDMGEAIDLGLDVRQWILEHAWAESGELELIEWVLNYINERTTTRHAYIDFEKEIVLGPKSPRAQTGELQNGFKLMKQLVEQQLSS